MIPEIADRLNRLYADGDSLSGEPDPGAVVAAIAAGARDAGLQVLNMEELDDVAAEMSGPPWP